MPLYFNFQKQEITSCLFSIMIIQRNFHYCFLMFDFLAEMDSNPICVFILVLIKFLALFKLNSAELREAFI